MKKGNIFNPQLKNYPSSSSSTSSGPYFSSADDDIASLVDDDHNGDQEACSSGNINNSPLRQELEKLESTLPKCPTTQAQASHHEREQLLRMNGSLDMVPSEARRLVSDAATTDEQQVLQIV